MDLILTDECNLMIIHQQAIKYLKNLDQQQLTEYHQLVKKNKAYMKANIGKLTVLQIKALKSLETPSSCLHEYHQKVDAIVEEFQQLGPIEAEVFYLGDPPAHKTLTPLDRQRSNLIKRYFSQVRNLLPIRYRHQERSRRENSCIGCGCCIDNESEVCPHCGMVETNQNGLRYSLEMTGQNDPQDLFNYIKYAEAYQGVLDTDIPETMIRDIDQYLRDRGHPDTVLVKNHPERYPHQPDYTRTGTQREYIMDALKALGHSKYYRYINYLCHRLWGWPIPKFQTIMEYLIADYKVSRPVFRELVKDHRQSCMGVPQHLYVDLYRYRSQLSFRLLECNFKIPKTEGIYETNCRDWNHTCEKLGWESPYMKSTESEVIRLGD